MWAPSEPKKWSGWTVIAGTGGEGDLDGVREGMRLLDMMMSSESDFVVVVVVVVVDVGDGDGDGERRRGEKKDIGTGNTRTVSLPLVMARVPRLMSMADLAGPQIQRLVGHAHALKQTSLPWLAPQSKHLRQRQRLPSQSLFNKSIALLFSKRSTRTRVSAETAAVLLGGRALFLGREDIQLGVNESPRDTARVLGGMCQGIFARVGAHEEIEVGSSNSRS